MPMFIPKFELYNSTDTVLVFTFPYVTETNAPQSLINSVEMTNLRGKGSIIINGGESPWDLSLNFVLVGTDYEDLIDTIDDMETDVVLNTPYILKIGKTSSTYFTYHVKRIQPFIYEAGNRVTFQRVSINLRANSW